MTALLRSASPCLRRLLTSPAQMSALPAAPSAAFLVPGRPIPPPSHPLQMGRHLYLWRPAALLMGRATPIQPHLPLTGPMILTAPTVTISSGTVSSGDTSNDSSISLTFTLSEAATDFISSDLSVTNGTISSFSGSGTSYSATFTPTSDGATSISVPANRFTDAASNGNTASSAFSWTYDGTAPTVTISSARCHLARPVMTALSASPSPCLRRQQISPQQMSLSPTPL